MMAEAGAISATGFTLAPMGPMFERAQAGFQDRIGQISISHPGQSGSIVTFYAAHNTSLLQAGYDGGMARSMTFRADNGQFVAESEKENRDAVGSAHTVIGGLHRAVFAGPLLRWLFFLSGVGGTVMIATGLVLWSVKRAEKRKGQRGHVGHRLVDVLNVGAVSGLAVATAAYFWANRLLAVELQSRAQWEIRAFFLVWLLTLLHPLYRPLKRAWIEQLTLAGLLLACLPVPGLLTGPGSLVATLSTGNWVVAGVDITFSLTGIALLFTAWRVHSFRGRVPRAEIKRGATAAQVAE